ncbi:uncharacterized protein LOC142227253 [Haematobia irritans]|uniref:uncharacterized protein LOC142227253 n=1 Tax=Haematobia irritans TaxID=7368 RepID=UPI003F4F5224
MDVGRRRTEARRLGYCFNCLARSHKTYECISETACRHCGEEHHTLLHIAPLVRVTYDEIKRGSVPSDIRHLLTSRRAQEHQLREAIDRQRIRDKANEIREGSRRLNARSTSRDRRLSPRRLILKKAMEALRQLEEALDN